MRTSRRQFIAAAGSALAVLPLAAADKDSSSRITGCASRPLAIDCQSHLFCEELGGTLPFIIGRLDHQTQVLKRGPKNLKRAPSEYLRQVWLDVVSPQPLAMKFGYDFMGADRLLFSSDHPWVEPKLIRDTLESLHLPPADLEKILTVNARKLFRL